MVLALLRAEQGGVGDLLGEGMFERIHRDGACGHGIEKLRRLELAECLGQSCLGHVGERLQQVYGDLLANDCRGLEEAPGRRREAIQACPQHRLDGIGHRHRERLRTLFQHGVRQFFKKKKVASGPGEHLRHQRQRVRGSGDDHLDDPSAVLHSQGLQGDLRGIRFIEPERAIPGTVTICLRTGSSTRRA
jgi:hypothetical protein